MIKRRRGMWSIVFVFVLLAAACGGNNQFEEEGAEEGDQETGGQIDVVAVWTGTEQENFEAVLDAFTEETGIEANYKSTGDDVGAYLGTQIEGGNPPDVAMLPQPGLLRDLAAEGSLVEANEEVSGALEENFDPIWSELGSSEGTLYGVYFKVANKSTWWYNKNVFEQAGVEPPATWDEMLQTAKTVNASGVPWVSIGGSDGWTLTDWFENIYIQTAGVEKYDQLANHEIPWTDQSVIDALDTFAQLVGDEANLAGGVSGALQTDFPTSVTKVFSDPPEAATVYEGDFVAGVITESTQAEPETGFNVFTFPSINDSPPSVVGGGDLVTMFRDSPAAQALVEYLATPEAAEIWVRRGGFVSPNKNVDPEAYTDETLRDTSTALTEAETFRFDLSDVQPSAFGATVGQGMWKLFQDLLRNPQNVDGIASQLEAAAARAHE